MKQFVNIHPGNRILCVCEKIFDFAAYINIITRVKILLCSDSYYPHPGGVSEYMHFLHAYMKSLGNEVMILAPYYREPFRDTTDIKRIGKCYLFNANMATITITFHHKLPMLVRDFIKQERFDVVHTNGPLGWTLPYWAFHYSRGLNIATFHTAFTGINLYRFVKLIFKHEVQKRMHGVIYPSKAAMKTTYPYFPLPHRIIPNGVDTHRFNPGNKPLEKFQNGRPKILFLGRLDPRKGLDKLLSAFPKIKAKIEDALLIVVGAGSSIAYYQRLVPENLRKSICFEGRVSFDLIPRYYASCDVYVSPATGGEVFGIVLAEAMATGKPVVASNIPGYNEVITDGRNGLLFDFNNPDDIADKVIQVLGNRELSKTLGVRAREYAISISWKKIAREVLNYYEELRAQQ